MKKYHLLVHAIVISIFVFIWLKIHLKFPDCYYFSYLGHLTITCFKTLKFLIPMHIFQPENGYKISKSKCYKLSMAYKKRDCLNILVNTDSNKICVLCSSSLTSVIVDQLQRINIKLKFSNAIVFSTQYFI